MLFRFAITVLTVGWLFPFGPAAAQSDREAMFVLALMESMNALSVRFDREVCGYILRQADGSYATTKASWGGHASCASLPVDEGATLVSSWHTHAAWSPDYDGEVPSLLDVEGDMDQGINGWIGTPGGRLWLVDGQTGTSRQFCGLGCLPVDPAFGGDDFGPVQQVYTLEALEDRFAP